MKKRYIIEFRNPTIDQGEWSLEWDLGESYDLFDSYDACLKTLNRLREVYGKSPEPYFNLREYRMIELSPKVLDI